MKGLSFKIVVFLACTTAFTTLGLGQATKSNVCHKAGSSYHLININNNALAAHTAHGDAMPGMAVPNQPGFEFSETCQVTEIPMPDFFPFYIRNNNSTIAPPWDADLVVAENAAGNGFAAQTPRGGQKVGYGTNYFDGLMLNTFETVNWDRVSGAANLVVYMNVWVTDGVNFAVISSENDYRGTDFATRQEWKVFEFPNMPVSLDWLCANGVGGRDAGQYLTCGGVRATLADLADVTIESPAGSYPAYVGTGAPRGGYGFNLIWGDTSVNFLGSYSMENLSITVAGQTHFPTSHDAPTN